MPIPEIPVKVLQTEKRIRIGVISVLGVIVLIIAIAAATGGSKSKPTDAAAAATTGASQDTSTSSRSPAANPSAGNSKQALRFYNKENHDANTVQVDIQAAITADDLVSKDSSAGISDVAQIIQFTDQAHTDLISIKDNFALATDGTGHIQDLEAEAFDAVNELKNSMGAMSTYLNAPTPGNLASFKEQYERGVAEWNESITSLWAAAGQTKPPTL